MINRELLCERDIETGRNSCLPDVPREIRSRRDGVARNLARLVVRAREALVYTDCEDRQVVEKERVEVIRVEHHDHIGARGCKLGGLRRKQLCNLAIGTVALDEERKYRGVRNSKARNDLGHPCKTP
jgi:hypothetical protein